MQQIYLTKSGVVRKKIWGNLPLVMTQPTARLIKAYWIHMKIRKKKNNFVQYSQAFISAFRKCRVNIEQAILISMTVSFPVSSENCLYILLQEAGIHKATIARQYVWREIV